MTLTCGLILLATFITTTTTTTSMASGSADLTGDAAVKEMASANLQFSLDLLRQVGGGESRGQSVFFAPFSISTALAMTYLGAGTKSKTAQEMKGTLRWAQDVPAAGFGSYLPLLNDAGGEACKGYTLVAAQRLFLSNRYTLKPQFSADTLKHFASQAQTCDFTANADGERGKINGWVSQQTRNKIQDLLPGGSVDPLTAMVLVQALYFKGNWLHKFDPMNTRPADFHAPQGTVKVDMMHQNRNFHYTNSPELGCAAVELPYARNSEGQGQGKGQGPMGGGRGRQHDLSMVILLPDKRDGLDALEAALTSEALDNVLSSLHSVKVDLQLPRFKVESSFALKEALSAMGMKEAFGDSADFSNMINEPEPLKISQVFHKAVVEVNEEGSEAAAATAVVMMTRCIQMPMRFVADHPFVFLIVDARAKVVLFSGRVVSPPPSVAKAAREEL